MPSWRSPECGCGTRHSPKNAWRRRWDSRPVVERRGEPDRDLDATGVAQQAASRPVFATANERYQATTERESEETPMPQGERIVLASRPVGEPKASDFRIEDCPIP